MAILPKYLVTFTFLSLGVGNVFAIDSLSYTGRLANSTGVSVTGPVDLKLELAYTDTPNGGVTAVVCNKTLSNTPLTNGVFHLKVDYTSGECGGKTIAQVLADAPTGETAALRVTDLTHSKVYSYHAIHALPFASVSNLSKNLVQMGATSGQVLKWNGTTWAPAADGGGGTGTVTQVNTGTGLTGGPITATGTIAVANSGITNSLLADGAVDAVKIASGAITSAKIHQMAATSGQVLKWSGAAWLPSNDSGLTTESDPTVAGFSKYTPPTCLLDNETLRFDALLNSGAGGLFCHAMNSDDIPEGSTNLYFTSARAKTVSVADAINNGTTDLAPSQNAVFDALALKQNLLSSTSDVEVRTIGAGTATPGARLGVAGTLSASSGTEFGMRIFPTVNQSGTASYTGLFMNITETQTGSGNKRLLDLQVGGVSRFAIDNTGAIVSSSPTNGTSANFTSAGGNQLTIGHDGSNRTTVNVGPLGFTTFSASGVGAGFNFTGGNVGVGVAVPAEAIDVAGSVRASVGVKTPLLSNLTDLSFTADSDANASGALIFNTGANERMRVLNNGRVGIGTTSPVSMLDIFNTTDGSDTILQLTSADGGFMSGQELRLDFSQGSSDTARIAMAYFNPDWGLNFYGHSSGLNTSPVMTMRGSGNVGIGTTTPQANLHIRNTVAGSTLLYLQGANNYNYEWRTLSGAIDGQRLDSFIGTSAAHWSWTDSTGERMRINGGNLGIGLNNPNSRLHIRNTAGANTTSPMLNLNDSGTGVGNGAAVDFSYASSNILNARIFGFSESGGGGSLRFATAPSDGAAAATAMTISRTGNVGIGTTTPSSKLSIIGNGSGIEPSLTAGSTSHFNVARGTTSSTDLSFTLSSTSPFTASIQHRHALTDGASYPLALNPLGGNVGIGTTTPTTRLDVVGPTTVASSAANFRSGDDSTAVWRGALSLSHNADTVISSGSSIGISFAPLASTGSSFFGIASIKAVRENATANNQDTALSFFTRAGASNTTTDTEKMRITSNGNVGIGTTNPGTWKTSIRGGALSVGTTDTQVAFLGADGSNVGYVGTSTNNPFQIRTNSSTRVTVDTSGNVGIGTTNPVATLDLATRATTFPLTTSAILTRGNDQNFQLQAMTGVASNNTGDLVGKFGMRNSVAGDNAVINFYRGGNTNDGIMAFSTNTVDRMFIIANGNVGIGTISPSERLHVIGNILASGTITGSSDIRLKKDIKKIPNALDKLSKINGVTYFWKETDKHSEGKQLGVIAQEVEKEFPEAVLTSDDGFKSVSYFGLIAPVIESIKTLYGKMIGNDQKLKELELKYKNQNLEIMRLNQRNRQLEMRLQKLESVLSK